MRARVAAGYLFGLLNTTEAFLMVQHLHIQSRKAATGGGFWPSSMQLWSSCQQRASIAREIAFPRHQSCSEEDAEDSFAVDNFVLQLTSNIDSEEKVKILSFLAIRSKAENVYFLRFKRIFPVDMSTKPNQLLEYLLAMQQFSFCNWPMQPADVLAFWCSAFQWILQIRSLRCIHTLFQVQE